MTLIIISVIFTVMVITNITLWQTTGPLSKKLQDLRWDIKGHICILYIYYLPCRQLMTLIIISVIFTVMVIFSITFSTNYEHTK